MKKLFVACCFFFIFQLSYAQTSLSETERKILASVDSTMPFTMQLLKESVNINSGTLNIEGVRRVGELYEKEFRALGFTTEWISLPDSINRAGHLVAFRKGSKGKKIFLIGHLDTVFEPGKNEAPFTMLSNIIAAGHGVNDMKGGDVMIVAALKALNELGLLDDLSITVYFTCDEENTGEPREISRADFIKRAKECDVALAFEPGSISGVTTARRGTSSWTLEVKSPQGHSCNIFGSGGYGSIFEASRILNKFREKLSKEKYLTFNPGIFVSGTDIKTNTDGMSYGVNGKTNIIPSKAIISGDLRFLTESQKLSVRARMINIVSHHLPGTTASISFKDGIPSMLPTKGNEILAKKAIEINLALGYGRLTPNDPADRGAGDISYIAKYLDCIDGLGASGSGAHTSAETINLKEYPKLIKRAALLIYRLTNLK